MEDELENAEEQLENSKVPKQLQPWMYRKGQSGNPGGRPKGSISMKQWVKERLESMTDEQREEFMEGLPKEIIWKMGEGMPQTNTDITSGGKPIPLFDNTTNVLPNNNSNEEGKSA